MRPRRGIRSRPRNRELLHVLSVTPSCGGNKPGGAKGKEPKRGRFRYCPGGGAPGGGGVAEFDADVVQPDVVEASRAR